MTFIRTAILVFLFVPAAALSQPDLGVLQQAVEERRAALEEAAALLSAADSQPDFLALREQLRSLRADAQQAVEPLRESRSEIQADLDRLGPAPEGGDVSESPEIVEERTRLKQLLVRKDAVIRQAELNIAEANRLLEDIKAARRDAFYKEIFSRGETPFSRSLWRNAIPAFHDGATKTAAAFSGWRQDKARTGSMWRSYGLIAGAAALGLILFGPLRRWTNRRVIMRLQALEPTPGKRAAAALARMFARALPGLIAGAIVFAVLRVEGIIQPEGVAVARNIWLGFVALLIVDAGALAAFAPHTPGWRLVSLDSGCAKAIRRLLLFLVFVFFLDRSLTSGAQVLGAAQELALSQSVFITVLMTAGVLALTQRRIWRLAEGREDRFSPETKSVWRNIRLLARGTALFAIAATALGYVAFGYYLVTRLFMLCGLVAAGLFARLIIQEFIHELDRRIGGDAAAESAETDQERMIFFWIGAFVDLTIILLLSPAAFLILGAAWSDVRDAVRDAFFGFTIGSVTISIAEFFAAVFVFFAILAGTRFVQRTTEKRFFPRTRLDFGVRNSLKTLIGYVGLVIAFMTAVGMLGFNMSNIAIIAGALSIGIGFGLQSIVNNFVSGLILLFERPIKVGDWVVVQSGEGIVKRISVRATEIETFDRSSVIVPNSELVSSTVQNWTHKDKIGRIIIPVGVSYNEDPAKVEALLLEVVKEHPLIMSYPEPFIYFRDFGDSSLDFELRAFIRDVSSSILVRSEARKMIFKKFAEAGVEIPFPQRDLHIKARPEEAASKASEAPARA